MPPRFFVDTPLSKPDLSGTDLLLPPSAARHVQVLRLQPGSPLTLFDGSGPEWQAEVVAMGRSEVRVHLQARQLVQRELTQEVTLAVVMPANDRMDGLVEKATELGVSCIQPLMSERSVLRLNGERADKKQAHWTGVAIAACEQSGRSCVPKIAAVKTLAAWLAELPAPTTEQRRWLLSPTAAQPLKSLNEATARQTLVLSGPEGGLSPAEEQAARERGFLAAQLGPRILRADTAPLAVLGWLALQCL
ncbi:MULTISPECIES: 16S rRNA (uracil(1498)-N(3))-methyltransferase [Roseateles]|uniref:Ribosomal RNA small subunit methyltransferase E n=1 Tax=Roseateles albus TaxID=2987525 RepID=A0ABT5KB88_9BURK|nr:MULTISPECIES: 16S rRNA (uracil(1498)-N(3))-methyltransferase [Roseateles]MCV2360702.1 16S rRNA (uracil(1498)-N(3))-methyltransferase [Paucibacter sp. TC2R-5]MDC8770250.1 16S rRNA (uracil(1498)-N(3))-methyltransferase [Roseateles albus]